MSSKFIYLYLICTFFKSGALNRTNLALNKETLSSQHYRNLNSMKAVDGIVGLNDGHCFHADGNRQGWLAVNLDKMVYIQTVMIYSRLDYGEDRMENMIIRLSKYFDKSRIVSYEVCDTYGRVSKGEKMFFNCGVSAYQKNRYVIVGPHYETYFAVCEIEIYEREESHKGCYEEVIVLSNKTVSSLDSCMSECFHSRTTFAGMTNGNRCVCSDLVRRRISPGTCDIPCSEEPSKFCGGSFAVSVYSVCNDGYFGERCEKVCHCKDRSPCTRQGVCFGECQPGWTGSNCDTMERRDRTPIGCFKMRHGLRNYGDLKSCPEFCNRRDYKYFIHSSSDCYCFDERDDCVVKEYYSYDLYNVCPPGSFGEFCLNECHCATGDCSVVDGKCNREECLSGWKGPVCNTRDCSINNGACGSNSHCQDNDHPYCLCHEGYNALASCQDEDECNMGTHGCNNFSSCQNTPGSYTCLCNPGFKKSLTDDKICEDIEECQMGVCDENSMLCIELPGSYECRCRIGFRFKHNDPKSCEDIDECATNRGGCDRNTTTCNNTMGSYRCVCIDTDGLLNDTHLFCQSLGLGGSVSKPHLKRLLFLTLIPLLVGLVILCISGTFFAMKHFRKLRKGFARLSAKNREGEALIDLPGNTKISLEDLEKYLENNQEEIQKQFTNTPKECGERCSYGACSEVKQKNRFKNIIPYDSNRVKLDRHAVEGHEDYINASYISEDGSIANARYIATQGPTDRSTEDIWSMVWQEEVDRIVMLTLLFEEGKNKCIQYWPDAGTKKYGKFSVTLKQTEAWVHYTVRKFCVSQESTKMERYVTHFQYTSWEDKGVPSHLESLLDLRRKVGSCSKGKVVVHCSAGVGRTGTFLGIDFLLKESSREGSVDFLRCLRLLRSQRTQMVQNLKQYILCHQVVLLDYKIGNTSLPAASVESYRRRLKELNAEDKDGKTSIDRQFQALLDETKNLEPSSLHKYTVVLADDMWFGSYFPVKGQPSALVAGVICDGFTSNHLVNILCRPDALGLILLNRTIQDILDSALPTEEGDIPLEGETLSLRHVEEFDEVRRVTYRVSTAAATYGNIQEDDSNLTTREFSVIFAPEEISVNGEMVDRVWKLANETPRDESSPLILLGSSYSKLGSFMAAANVFEMIRRRDEANIFQIVLDLALIHPDVLDFVSYCILHRFVEEHLLLKKEVTADEDAIYVNADLSRNHLTE